MVGEGWLDGGIDWLWSFAISSLRFNLEGQVRVPTIGTNGILVAIGTIWKKRPNAS
jgi:hypothetical protein